MISTLALTTDGRVYTWGYYSLGALGLGDPQKLPVGAPGEYTREEHKRAARNGIQYHIPDVLVPTEVRFDYGERREKDRFCFVITAGGWHTGALVLNDDSDMSWFLPWMLPWSLIPKSRKIAMPTLVCIWTEKDAASLTETR